MDNILGIGINVTFSGIVIVFAMLVLLVLILVLFGIVGQLFKKESQKPVKVEVEPAPKAVPAAERESNEPSSEIIAVIAAAVATMYSGSGVRPVIKTVKRVGVRPAWASAGIADNTRPF